MANQSKSMVFGFVIIAAIIFAVALGYKMTQDDQPTQKVTIQPVVEKNVEPEVKEPKIKVVSYDNDATDRNVMPSPEEQAETEARAPHFMSFAMRYHSAQEALDALPALIENGKDEEAHFLVKFIESQFPDTRIPEEFADL